MFIFTLLCSASKGFMIIKPFETPQKSVKIKIFSWFFSSSGIGVGIVKNMVGWLQFPDFVIFNFLLLKERGYTKLTMTGKLKKRSILTCYHFLQDCLYWIDWIFTFIYVKNMVAWLQFPDFCDIQFFIT